MDGAFPQRYADVLTRLDVGLSATDTLMVTVLGMALGGWLSGEIYDLTGSYQAAFLNGIAWTAKLEIPASGVASKALTKEQLRELATVFQNTSKVSVPPASVVTRPEVGLIVKPAVSLSLLVAVGSVGFSAE